MVSRNQKKIQNIKIRKLKIAHTKMKNAVHYNVEYNFLNQPTVRLGILHASDN